jgi:hypothetical protein
MGFGFSGLGASLQNLLTPEVLADIQRKQQMSFGGPDPQASPLRSPFAESAQIPVQQQPPQIRPVMQGLGEQPFNAAGQLAGNSLGGNFADVPEQPVDRSKEAVFGPAYDRFRELQQKGPIGDIDPVTGQPKKMGFGERLMHGLKAGGLAFLATGNPLLGLIGFGLGTARPQTYHDQRYNLIDQPQAYRRAKEEADLQGEQVHRAIPLSNMRGIDIYSGQPTQGALTEQDRKANNEMARQIAMLNAKSLEKSRTGNLSIRERQLLRQQARDNAKAFNDRVKLGGGGLTDEQVQDIADQFEIEIPAGYNYRIHDLKPNAQGVYEPVDRATGLNRSGQPVTSYETTKEAGRSQRAAESEAGKTARAAASGVAGGPARGDKLTKEFEEAKSKVGSWDEQWRRLSQMVGQKGADGKVITQGQVDAIAQAQENAKREFEAVKAKARAAGIPLTKDGEGIDYGAMGQGATAAPAGAASAPAAPSKSFPASKLSAYAKKYHGGNVNAARKELTAGGYAIEEGK